MRTMLVICVLTVVLATCGGTSEPTLTVALDPTALSSSPTPSPPSVGATEVPPTVAESGPEEISWKDGRRNVRANARVCGEVATAATFQDDRTVVNLGDIPSEGGVIVVITVSSMFPEGQIQDQKWKQICVSGQIVRRI
jgi:hypothetical protein